MRIGTHRFFYCCLLLLIIVLLRLLPHPANITPIAAISLFSGAYLYGKGAWLIPVFALLLSDLIIGLYAFPAMLCVYLGLAANIFLGRFMLSRRRHPLRIGGAALIGATVFFLLSNFGTWLTGSLYPMTVTGLVECYIMAIPFFANSLLGDLLYTAALFGLYERFFLQTFRDMRSQPLICAKTADHETVKVRLEGS